MIAENKITEIFCMADDFCKLFDAMTTKYTLKPTGKRKYHRSSTMSKAEVMLIMILFHTSGYRCFKHFYLEKVCKHLRIFTNRGETDYFVDDVTVLDKDFANVAKRLNSVAQQGRVVDTIYVVLDKSELKKQR